ncbi:hypothetical protein QE411_003118 [Microbacterium arborescens]|nr:hypothetical protein [Microbacterium arborescens]
MSIRWALSLVAAGAICLSPGLGPVPANAVTTGNGSLVYAPPDGSSFNDEGGEATGTAYAKVVALKHSGAHNGMLVSTFDDARLIRDDGSDLDPTSSTQACLADPSLGCHQEWPIFRSLDGGSTWAKVGSVDPGLDFPGVTGERPTTRLDRTAQPFLYELPQPVGSMPAGTLLLAGQIRPAERSAPASVSKLVLYRSDDHGSSWTYVSTIDTGGPAVYDPSPTSTTTTVWEPTLAIDAQGGLVAYFSDERQKSAGVLQAVSYRRSLDGGASWGAVENVSAPPDSTHRPGMITVDRLPDGAYIATYEVVNAAGYAGPNASPVFFKKSPDGLDWGDPTSLGEPVELADGHGIGSSPFVKWVPSGGPHGMVVVASKWGLDAAGNVYGGQNFFVNYNLGAGPWERLPFAVTFDGPSSITGFAQGIDYSPDGLTLYQATNVENHRPDPAAPGEVLRYNDIRIGSIPLNATAYEAENAQLVNVSLVEHADAVGGSKVGNINFADSAVTFDINAPAAGDYLVDVRYANGTGAPSAHSVSVNGAAPASIVYSPTADWGRYLWAQTVVRLHAGVNTLRFGYQAGYAEIDQIQVHQPGLAAPPEFSITNRKSGKLLEVTGAATTDGAPVGQWGATSHPTQIWQISTATEDSSRLVNKNSGKLLEVPNAALGDGVGVVQWGPTGHATQHWAMEPDAAGWWVLRNQNSNKLLEIESCSPSDGARAQQWASTGAPCQQWRLTREAIQ